jgi:DNA-binding transcriptional ArsR family regulator
MRRSAAAPLEGSAPLFRALGDETRLHVVARLSEEGPLSITELTGGTNVSRQAVTKHLHVLADAGLVHSQRGGGSGDGNGDKRENVWTLEPRRLEEARRLLDLISREWDNTLDRLKAFVED